MSSRGRSDRPSRPGLYRPPPRWTARAARGGAGQYGLYYQKDFVGSSDRAEILSWLAALHPIWEERFSTRRPPPEGELQRRLLRPVYWLGNWQFACLDYYRPPHGVDDRCVAAEPFPPVLERLVKKMEAISRRIFHPEDIPAGWHLNTCLVNLYGDRVEGDRRIDTARVGEHRDFEPGPVASVSLGERALIQFVTSKRPGEREGVEAQQWLDDGSLQIFGGERWKRRTFHRVQRVDRREGHDLPPARSDFVTRRVNFTFRYVPDEHVVPFARLSHEAREDVRGYMEELARNSPFFAEQLRKAPPAR